ncbi:hypothetical protein [Hymenobacter antarcticus]|uniref:Uncharacterized protein n=1 Tax=Hymenobacter antarcticus TaxID=486270 RepID=A0ABP7P5P5_9BACT
MYRIVTKYSLLGLRNETDPVHQSNYMVLKPISGVPHEFETEQAAFDWALNNHEDIRHYPEFVVLPVHRAVLTWRPDDTPTV